MILADTRHQLTRDDAQLAARILARDSGDELASLESRLANEGIDAILDDPRLPAALLRHPRGAHASFTLFAYVMVRHALRRAGEGDRAIADYVSAIVIHFGFRDRAIASEPATTRCMTRSRSYVAISMIPTRAAASWYRRISGTMRSG